MDNLRKRAYFLWVAAGRPFGDGVNFWLQAQAEMAALGSLTTPATGGVTIPTQVVPDWDQAGYRVRHSRWL